MTKVAINGLGRIGRATFKIVLDNPELELVAVNDIADPETLVYLLRYDSVYGRYEKKVETDEENIIVEGEKYPLLGEKDPASLPWKDMGTDVVFECTGLFTEKEDLEKHLQAGTRKVILSAPPKSEGVETFIPGVSEEPDKYPNIMSTASCTTNCIAPVMEIMDRRIGVKKALLDTVHAYTSSQKIVDGPSKKRRRGRAAAVNLVPTSTGAAKATGKTLPQFKDTFDGIAIRGPVPVGSVADITMVTERTTSTEEIADIFNEEAGTDRYKGILGATDEELVSSDIIKDSRASVVDLQMTRIVDGDLVKVMSWYDNEWGYSNQMVKHGAKVAKRDLEKEQAE